MRRAEPPLDADLSGLDALELPIPARKPVATRLWAVLWPKLAALAFALAAWQLVVWSGWRPPYILPGPITVFGRLVTDIGGTMSHAAVVAREFGIPAVTDTAAGTARLVDGMVVEV